MAISLNSLRLTSALALLGLAACGDATKPGSLRLSFALNDQVGDTITQDADAQVFPALDAQRVSGYVTADSLILSIVFTSPIASPVAQTTNSVAAIVDLDADADSSTGIPPFTSPFGDNSQLGIEYELVFPDGAGTGVEVRDIVLQQVTSYPVHYDGDSLTVRLPISAVSTFSTPLRMVAVIGTLQRPTDIIPNAGYLEIDRLAPPPSADRIVRRDLIPSLGAGNRSVVDVRTPWSGRGAKK